MRIEIHLDYVPPSHNRIMGEHWSVLHHEKRRAALALHRALRSPSSFVVSGQEIGITTAQNSAKMHLSKLESCLATDGTFFPAKSSRSKLKAAKTKAPQS